MLNLHCSLLFNDAVIICFVASADTQYCVSTTKTTVPSCFKYFLTVPLNLDVEMLPFLYELVGLPKKNE